MLGFGHVGAPELLGIAIIALLLFGPQKLPEMARTAGRVLRELKKMSSDFTDELKLDLDEPAVHPLPATEETSSPEPAAPEAPALNGHGVVAGKLPQREYPPGKEPI